MRILAIILSFCVLALGGAGYLEFRDASAITELDGSCCADHDACCNDDAGEDGHECLPDCSCHAIALVAGMEIHIPRALSITYQVIHYPARDEHYLEGYPRHLLQPPRCV